MRNGHYASSMNIDGRLGIGSLEMADNHAQGSDGVFVFEIQFRGSGNDMVGIVNVLIDPESSLAHRTSHHFSLNVFGSGSDDRFNMIGTGPAGVLVELSGDWEGDRHGM